jgi:hypothetical protein
MSRKTDSSSNILIATVYNTDGSIKTDLAYNTTGISIVVKRLGMADSSALTLSNKSAPDSTWSAGAFLNIGNGRITVDVANSYFGSSYLGEIWISGSFTGGTIIGDREQVVAYDPNTAAVGANTTAPATPTNVSDVQTAVLAKLPSALVSGRMDSSVGAVAAGAIAATAFAANALDAVWSTTARTLSATGVAAIWDAATSGMSTAGSIGKRLIDYLTGDIFARLGAPAGASTAADIAAAKADLATLTGRLTSARAGYLDNLNVGGAVASNADIVALNQSASRRIVLTTVGQYERPESGSTVYTIEARTYDGDGANTNADSNPTLTVTGQTTGSLAANVGTITNPAVGCYRWTYTQGSSATIEPIRVDVSATISSVVFTLSAYTQSVDFVAATWSTTDAANLTAVYNKLPTNNIADQTILAAAIAAEAVKTTGLDTKLGTPAGASVSADIAAVKSDTATILSRVTSTVATLWANLTAMISGGGGTAAFTETALANAPAGGGGGGGLSEEQQAQLDEIEAHTSLITSTTRISVAADAGSDITLKIGDDYDASIDTAKRIEINDADSSIYDLLTDVSLTAIAFGCGLGPKRDLVTGTVDPETITHTAAVGDVPAYTTIFVECTVADTVAAIVGKYDIQITHAGGKKQTVFSGDCTLVNDFKS